MALIEMLDGENNGKNDEIVLNWEYQTLLQFIVD